MAIIVIQFGFPNVLAYADSPTLMGEVQHNHLVNDASLKDQAAVNCAKQADYAQAISDLLKGYGMNNLFSIDAHKNNLQGIAQPNINANTKKATADLQDILANHDLAIIVDRSGSMDTTDCPGRLSRWQWCSGEASQLAQAAEKASSSVTMTFFNNNLQIFDSVRPENIPGLFKMYTPTGGTLLRQPLVAQLDRYFAKRSKPLIVVVITDGISQDTDLPAIIRDASDSLRYIGEVSISFLLVGNEVHPDQFRNLLGELNNGGIKNGGLVDVIGFNQLTKTGIKQTLFDELKTISLATNKSVPSPAKKFSTGRNLATTFDPLSHYPVPGAIMASHCTPAVKTCTCITVFQSSNGLNPFPLYSIAANPRSTKSTNSKAAHKKTQ